MADLNVNRETQSRNTDRRTVHSSNCLGLDCFALLSCVVPYPPPPPCLGTALCKNRPLVPRSNAHTTFSTGGYWGLRFEVSGTRRLLPPGGQPVGPGDMLPTEGLVGGPSKHTSCLVAESPGFTRLEALSLPGFPFSPPRRVCLLATRLQALTH